MKRECRVCLSEYRDDIEKLLETGKPYRSIAVQFYSAFGCSVHSLEQSLSTHKRHKKEMEMKLLAEEKKHEAFMALTAKMQAGTATKEDFHNTLITIAYQDLRLHPERVKHKDVINFQRLLIKERQLEVRYELQSKRYTLQLEHLNLKHEAIQLQLEKVRTERENDPSYKIVQSIISRSSFPNNGL